MQFLKFALATFMMLCLPTVRGQWVFTDLHSGSTGTSVLGLSQAFQAGNKNDSTNAIGGVTWRSSSSTVAPLTPPGYVNCFVRSVSGNTVYGDSYNGGSSRATFWPGGDSNTSVDLHPFGALGASRCYSGSDICQVGTAKDLVAGDIRLAAMWVGNASSFVRLHPSWASTSVAFATYGSRQFGWTSAIGAMGVRKATVWQGSQASATVVHPAWAGTASSEIWAAGDGMQVGFVGNGTSSYRACAWLDGNPTPVDLNPSWAAYSQAASFHGGKAVGIAVPPNGSGKAVIWHEADPNSCEDLSPFIPGECLARAVFVDDSGIFVGGDRYTSGYPYAWLLYKPTIPSISGLDPGFGYCSSSNIVLSVSGVNLGGGSRVYWNGQPLQTTVLGNGLVAALPPVLQGQAALGSVQVKNGPLLSNVLPFELRQVVSPLNAMVLTGTALSGGLPEVLNRDDQYLRVRPSFIGSRTDPNVVVESHFSVSVPSPSSLILTYEVAATSNPNTIKLQAYDYQSGAWVNVASVQSSQQDTDVVASIGNPGRFIQGGVAKSRFTLKPDNSNTSRSWQVRIDFASLEIRP